MATISDGRRHELESKSSKSRLLAVIIGALLGPLGYVYVGEWRWAIICFFTGNYLLLGIAIVPIHCLAIISSAKRSLSRVDASE